MIFQGEWQSADIAADRIHGLGRDLVEGAVLDLEEAAKPSPTLVPKEFRK